MLCCEEKEMHVLKKVIKGNFVQGKSAEGQRSKNFVPEGDLTS